MLNRLENQHADRLCSDADGRGRTSEPANRSVAGMPTRFESRALSTGAAPTAPRKTVRIAFVLLPDFTLGALASILDPLQSARLALGQRSNTRLHWTFVGNGSMPSADCPAPILRETRLSDAMHVDCLVIVGGQDAMFDFDPALLRLISKTAERNNMVVGMGTGVFALAASGILDCRVCSVGASQRAQFAAMFPKVGIADSSGLSEDGAILTCADGMSGAAVVSRILDGKLKGYGERDTLSNLMTGRNLDAPVEARQVLDLTVRRAIALMLQHISEPMPIDRIAARVGVTSRQLARRFKNELNVTPSAQYRLIRLEHAQCLLRTGRTVTEIAFDCGFADAAHLTRSFKAQFGTLPTAYRSATRQNLRKPFNHREDSRAPSQLLGAI